MSGAQSCVKRILFFFSFIILIVGIAAIGFGFYEMFKSGSDIWKYTPWEWGNVLGVFIIVIGFLTMLIGIFGVFGSLKRNKCCLCLYQFSVFPLMLIFLAVAIAATIITNNYIPGMQNNISRLTSQGCNYASRGTAACDVTYNNNNLDWLNQLNSVVTDSLKYFGQTDQCQIYVEAALTEQLTPYLPNQENTNSNLPTTAQQCTSQFGEFSSDMQGYGNLMGLLEQTFQCSGLYYAVPFHLFSDVNTTPQTNTPGADPIKNGACFNSITDFFDNWGTLVYVIGYIAFAFLLLNVILSCCLCCSRKKEGGGVYHRMSYLD